MDVYGWRAAMIKARWQVSYALRAGHGPTMIDAHTRHLNRLISKGQANGWTEEKK